MTKIRLAVCGIAALFMSQIIGVAVAQMPLADETAWRAYTPEVFEKLRENEQPTLVFCDADWCLNCQAMEAIVLKRTSLREYVIKNKIVMVKLDYTEPSEPASAFMKNHGLKSVPAILFFPGKKDTKPLINKGPTTETALLKMLGGEPTSE